MIYITKIIQTKTLQSWYAIVRKKIPQFQKE